MDQADEPATNDVAGTAPTNNEPVSGENPERATGVPAQVCAPVDVNQLDDVIELAMLARHKAADVHRVGSCDLQQAVNLVMLGLEMRNTSPAASVAPRSKPLRRGCFRCFMIIAVVVFMVMLLTVTREIFTTVRIEGDVLVAAGAGGFSEDRRLAATAQALETRSLAACAQLPASALRNIRDVVLAGGEWRRVRVAHAVQHGDGHIWLEALDGTGVRVQGGRVSLRLGALGDEEFLNDLHAFASVASTSFDVVAEIS